MLIERSVSDILPLTDNKYVLSGDPTLNTEWITPDTTTVYLSHSYIEILKRKSGIKVSHNYIEVLVRHNGWQIFEA